MLYMFVYIFTGPSTGFDNAIFRDAAKKLTGTAEAGARMRAIPELMYFLDKDPTVSAFFRNRESGIRGSMDVYACMCICVLYLVCEMTDRMQHPYDSITTAVTPEEIAELGKQAQAAGQK